MKDLKNNFSPSTPNNLSYVISSRRRTLKKHYQTQKTRVADNLQSQDKILNYAAYIGLELEALTAWMTTYCQKIMNDALFHAKCCQPL